MVLGFEIFWEEFIGHWGEEREPEPGFMAFNRRALIFYVTFMTSGTFVALGALTLWHARLINAGQTSIEAHINRSETKRLAELGRIYRNPYNFGPKHNWHLFLGLVDGRYVCTSVSEVALTYMPCLNNSGGFSIFFTTHSQ